MIHIIIDYSNIINDPGALVIQDNQSYLQTYSVLGKLKLHQDEITIVIKRKIYWIWVERFINRLEENYFKVETASLKSLLQSKWNCLIPKEVSDNIIKDCCFLELDEIPASGETFDDFVLRIYFGSVLMRKTITLEDIPVLLEQSCSEKWNNSQKLVFLKSFLYNQH